MVGGIPSINSLESCYLDLERPNMVGELLSIVRRVGWERFPYIPISYFSNPKLLSGGFFDHYPCVIKVSHAHAGMGKAKVGDEMLLKDISKILSFDNDYCTAEPYIDTEYGIRVQKIGNSYRVYKKIHTGSGWKSQFGGAGLFEIPLTDTYKFWADECAKCYGGMELLAVDAVHGKDGKDYILELNATSIGIVGEHWLEESRHIVDMVINKINWIYCKDMINDENGQKK